MILPALGILAILAMSTANTVSTHKAPWNTIAYIGVYTGGLLLLYFTERRKAGQTRDMNKTRIQDL